MTDKGARKEARRGTKMSEKMVKAAKAGLVKKSASKSKSKEKNKAEWAPTGITATEKTASDNPESKIIEKREEYSDEEPEEK